MRLLITLICSLLMVTAGCGGTDSKPVVATAGSSNEAISNGPGGVAPNATCAYTGILEDYELMQVELNFANTLGEVDALEVTYALVDGDGGTPFASGKEKVKLPKTNEKFRISSEAMNGMPPDNDQATITCRVLSIEKDAGVGDFHRATAADTCEILDDTTSGGLTAKVSATSPFDATAMKLPTWWALQGPGNVRFRTDTDVSELVGVGDSIHLSQRVDSLPEWIGDGEITCAVLGFSDQEQ